MYECVCLSQWCSRWQCFPAFKCWLKVLRRLVQEHPVSWMVAHRHTTENVLCMVVPEHWQRHLPSRLLAILFIDWRFPLLIIVLTINQNVGDVYYLRSKTALVEHRPINIHICHPWLSGYFSFVVAWKIKHHDLSRSSSTSSGYVSGGCVVTETDRLVGDTCLLIYCVNFRLGGWVGRWGGHVWIF